MTDDEPEPRSGVKTTPPLIQEQPSAARVSPVSWLKTMLKGKESNSNSLREALEDYIEDIEESHDNAAEIDSHHELVTNVLKSHELNVDDIMIPRADIIGIEASTSFDDLRAILIEQQYSRLPVYKDKLDDVIGAIHIKDILAALLRNETIVIEKYVREVSFVSPSMPLMDLLNDMKKDKKHMALVVDEFGGIDGLVTINDIIEAIVGDIEDEFDEDEAPMMIDKPDGSIIVDGRLDVDDFEEIHGSILTAEEREDVETFGGLASSIAGRIPARGELLTHSSGLTLEILDADGRRVRRIRLRHVPSKNSRDEV